jgi:hypothetical protein
MFSRVVTYAAAASLAISLGACSTMKAVPAPARYIEAERPKLLRLTQSDGSRVMMIGARMEGDTVMGFVQTSKTSLGEFREVPMQDITKVEAQQYTHTLTALAIMGAFVGWAAITYAVVRQVDTQGGQVN